jgi:hypothetical protein
VAGETDSALLEVEDWMMGNRGRTTSNATSKRKDSGMSGISVQASPEAAVPMARDFAHDLKHEKHDTNKAKTRKASGSSSTGSSEKENFGVWRRIKGMARFGSEEGSSGKACAV